MGNIIPTGDEEDIDWGALYEIDENCLKALDEREGCNKEIYERRKIICLTDDGRKIIAWVCLRDPQPQGEPSEKYRQTVITGARECSLPEDYIEKVLMGKKYVSENLPY